MKFIRFIIINEPFTVEYTGLKRFIGSANLYKENLEKNNFPTNFDLTIPLNETTEKGKSVDEYYQNQPLRQMPQGIGA